MILCITLNPAIDRTLIVPGLRPGVVLRAAETLAVAGGKGLNVARVILRLGVDAACAGFLAGYSGRLVADLAEREGLHGAWTWIGGETRTCIILVDPLGGEPITVYEAGPVVGSDDWARLTNDVLREAAAANTVCLSGSLPPGAAPAAFAALLRALRDARGRVWVDTSGPALHAALDVESIGIKVNGVEASEILGMTIEQPGAALAAAQLLRRRTGADVVLTLGGRGAVLAGNAGGWHAQPPELQIVSAVGSGDAFLAGLAVAQSSGRAAPEALRHAVAAGAANALSVGGGQFRMADFNAILERTTLERLF